MWDVHQGHVGGCSECVVCFVCHYEYCVYVTTNECVALLTGNKMRTHVGIHT